MQQSRYYNIKGRGLLNLIDVDEYLIYYVLVFKAFLFMVETQFVFMVLMYICGNLRFALISLNTICIKFW